MNEDASSMEVPLLDQTRTLDTGLLSSRGNGRGTRKVVSAALSHPNDDSEQDENNIDELPPHVQRLLLQLDGQVAAFSLLSGLTCAVGLVTTLSAGCPAMILEDQLPFFFCKSSEQEDTFFTLWGFGLALSMLCLITLILPTVVALYKEYEPIRMWAMVAWRRVTFSCSTCGGCLEPLPPEYLPSLQQNMMRDAQELLLTIGLGQGCWEESQAGQECDTNNNENDGSKTRDGGCCGGDAKNELDELFGDEVMCSKTEEMTKVTIVDHKADASTQQEHNQMIASSPNKQEEEIAEDICMREAEEGGPRQGTEPKG